MGNTDRRASNNYKMSKYYFYTFYSDIVTVNDRLTLQKIRDSVIRDLLNKHDIKHWPLPDESFSSKILDKLKEISNIQPFKNLLYIMITNNQKDEILMINNGNIITRKTMNDGLKYIYPENCNTPVVFVKS